MACGYTRHGSLAYREFILLAFDGEADDIVSKNLEHVLELDRDRSRRDRSRDCMKSTREMPVATSR